jgi:PiT family inorganic phosphate transporter
MAAIGWHALTLYLGIPSSSSHGLVGGMAGAALAGAGVGALESSGLVKILLGLFLSPLLGFGVGFGLLRLIYLLAARATPKVNDRFRNWQLLTVFGLALTNGANDAQKAMGIIALTLVLSGGLGAFEVPFWVVLICAGTMALGAGLGGWRLIRTLGGKFYKVRAVHSFSVQSASMVVLFFASIFGWPVSTSHVVSSAIIGVGSSERISKVRWGAAAEIVIAWLLTVPATALVAAAMYWVMKLLRL